MEQFLRWEKVDVDKEIPKQRGKYMDVKGKAMTRSEALKNEVQELHQAYIYARVAGLREVPTGCTGIGFKGDELSLQAPTGSVLTAATSSPAPISPTKPLRLPLPKRTMLPSCYRIVMTSQLSIVLQQSKSARLTNNAYHWSFRRQHFQYNNRRRSQSPCL
jgi:hypothetical protein